MAGPWDDYKAKGSTDGKPWEEFGGKPEKPKTAAGDIARSLKSGVQQLPGIVTGIADIPTALAFGARPFTKAADAIGEATGFQPGKWAKETQYSEGYNDSKKAVDEAWKGVEGVASDPTKNWTDVAKRAGQDAGSIAAEYLKNPLYTANQVVESLPAMFAGGAVSKGLMTAGRVAGAGLTAEAIASGAMGPTRNALPGYLERAVGEKMAAPIAGGVGEGVMQAGQQMEEGKDNPDQRKNAIAALWSGAGNALISMGAGRLANKLGFETAETAMAKAGDGKVATGLGAAKRIGGGVASEGLLQELPQSVQEQNWQNWAEGKPLMEGALRAGVEGALAGGIMGAGANIHPGSPAQTPPPADPGTAPGATPGGPSPQLGYDPMAGTHTVFPDGSIVLNSESSNGAKTVRDMQRATRLENAADPFFGDPAPVKPSEAMGLAPTAVPSLANAAILSVDSGIHQAATEAADPYNAPLSALGQELSRTNQRLRQEADALGLDTEGLHGDAARMTDGKSHEDYLMAANDQLRKAMKAAKEIPYDGQRSGSDDPAPGSEAKGPDAQAGETPAWDAAGAVRAGAVRPATDRVGEHGQRPAGTDGGSLPGAVAAPTRDQAIAKASDAAGKVLASGGTDADANRAATDSLIDQMAATPGIAIAQDVPAAVKAAKAKPPANNNAQTTPSAPISPTAGLPAAGSATVQSDGVSKPEDRKAKWLKAINDQNRLAGETGIQLKVVDGKLTFMGDPQSSKQGRALSATLAEAQKAGATIQEIIASIQNHKGTTANVPQPAQPGTQASQAPSAQGAPPAVGDKPSPAGAVAPDAKVRSYNLVAINEKTGEKTTLTKDPVSHQEAVTIKSKFADKDGRRIQLEEAAPAAPPSPEKQKALDRIASGKAWFGSGPKAQQFIAQNGLKDTHTVKKTSATRFDVVANETNPTQPQKENQSGTTTYQAQQAETQRPQEPAAAAGPVAGAPLPNATAPEHVSAGDEGGVSVAAATANPKIKAALDKKQGLGAQLAALNAELERQGAVQNANTRAERDAIRKQIAEQDFPEILKAVDGNIDTAEELNRAFQYAGDEPKAKTIERVLKKRGITPEYQKRWGDRLMEGQQAGTKPESVVKVPEAIGTAIQEQMEKQKRRVMRRRSEESAPGLNLEQKVAAQTKTKAAEATLRQMRSSVFDAEDAAVKAIETGKASEFEKHADLFPAANDAIRAMLGQNDELDAETQAYESGLTAQTRADDVKKLVEAAKKQEKAPAPGTRINGPAERAAADRLEKLVGVMPATMKPRAHSARAQVKGVIEQLRKDKTVVGVIPTLETASQRFMADGHAPFSEVIDEVIDSLNAGEQPAPPTPTGGEIDLMGFTKTPTGNGSFTLTDSNMRVTVEPTGMGLRARMGSGSSGPRLTEQQAIEWAASMRDESIRIQKEEAKKKPEAKQETGPTAEQIAAIGDITIDVPTENGTAKMTVNAAKALASIDERLDALKMVQRCLA